MTELEFQKQNIQNTIFILKRDIESYTRMLQDKEKELEAINVNMKLLGSQE